MNETSWPPVILVILGILPDTAREKPHQYLHQE